MNDHTIALVRETFDLLEPIAPQAGATFWADLADAEPALPPGLRGDPAAAGAALMQGAARVVHLLDEPEALLPLLDELGRRGAARGLTGAHWDAMAAPMLRTLYACLGVAYNAEVEEAWLDMFGAVSARLRQAADAPLPA